MMELNTVSVQEVRGSFFIYIPKPWAKEKNLKKGSKVSWSLKEGDHDKLILKVKEDKNV